MEPAKYLSHDIPQKRLSRGEWELMRIVWKLDKPFSVEAIHKEACKSRQRDFYTVNTQLKRMETKGWIAFNRRVRRPYPGRPLIDPQAALIWKVQDFLLHELGKEPDALAEVQRQVDALKTQWQH